MKKILKITIISVLLSFLQNPILGMENNTQKIAHPFGTITISQKVQKSNAIINLCKDKTFLIGAGSTLIAGGTMAILEQAAAHFCDTALQSNAFSVFKVLSAACVGTLFSYYLDAYKSQKYMPYICGVLFGGLLLYPFCEG